MDSYDFNEIEKMAARQDRYGLRRLLVHSDKAAQLEAALVLAEMDDEDGWRYLADAVTRTGDRDFQTEVMTALVNMDHPRAISILEEALKNTSSQTAGLFKQALEAIGGREADEALRRAGYEPVLPHLAGNLQLVDYEGRYVRSVTPDTLDVEFLTAEQHLQLAVDLREAELAERGLVENSLALWLSPEWAGAWYLRGVLFEDLERSYEASLCYRWALELDSYQEDAAEALADLEAQFTFPNLGAGDLLTGMASMNWHERRDAAAGTGELGEDAPDHALDRLIELLKDEEREVRHAAIEAITNIGAPRAVASLISSEESSWLLRFSVIEALAQIGSVDGLTTVLRREMDRLQERNRVFSSEKDPLIEVEYDRLMEIGVLAFQKTGDLEGLLDLAEGNAWEAADDDEGVGDEDTGGEESLWESESEPYTLADDEMDEDLEAYVDEVALMSSLALERLALPALPGLGLAPLRRLAAVPDLTLLDVSGTETDEPEPVTVHDLSGLREAARVELEKRA